MLQEGAGAQGSAAGREGGKGNRGNSIRNGHGRGETQGKWKKMRRGRALGGWQGTGGEPLGGSAGRRWRGSGLRIGAEKLGRMWREGKTSGRWGHWGRRSSLAPTSPLTRQLSLPQCAAHKLCHPEELVLLGHSLGIPQASLGSCSSQALQLTGCLSQLHSGLFLYQGLLQALAGISPELAPTLDTLQLDVTDFATNIWLQMEDLGMAPASPPTPGTTLTFTSAFQRRAGGVLVAAKLQRFLELAYRVLRYLAEP
ncbi:granulocyte colony-stimulating factor isoform X1 [Camelus bactrianus]|uniref:Granulocyte colony-stimulating factor isoform X1 n=1 Tax=Camelus bactrianus TaxID=9837 RepID=A0AC58NML4_CAMBA|nr:granulocyte colony-stimulating factor isoform X1 [Camelus dromedarius]